MLNLLTEQVAKRITRVVSRVLLCLIIESFLTSALSDTIAESNIDDEGVLYNEVMSCFQSVIDVDEFEFSDYVGVPLNSRVDLTCELNGNTFKFGMLTKRLNQYDLVTYYQGIVEAEFNNNDSHFSMPFGLNCGMNIHDVTRQLELYNYQVDFKTDEHEASCISISEDNEYTRQEGVFCSVHIEMTLELMDGVLNKTKIIVEPYLGAN